MDYNKLIEQLRTTQSRSKRALLDSAADAIETLLQEAERNLEGMNALKAHLYDVELVELPKIKAERDAVMGFVKRYCECDQCKHGYTHPDCKDDCDCVYCTSETCVCRRCRDLDKWEWKGLERECK